MVAAVDETIAEGHPNDLLERFLGPRRRRDVVIDRLEDLISAKTHAGANFDPSRLSGFRRFGGRPVPFQMSTIRARYTASDGTLTASSTAMLDITPVNDVPVASPVTLRQW